MPVCEPMCFFTLSGQKQLDVSSQTYSGGIVLVGEETRGGHLGGLEYPPAAYGIRLMDGLLVGPAMGLVGALASDSVTVKLFPFHPFVDSLSIALVRKYQA